MIVPPAYTVHAADLARDREVILGLWRGNLGQDARMAAVCRALAEGGQAVGQGGERAENLAATAADWAARLAMGEKTFHRHFLQATGLSFGRWRQRARLLSSMQALLAGRPIVQVALEAGYESHSAYSLAFRRQFGMPPSAFGARGDRL